MLGDRERDYLLADENADIFLSRYFPDKLYGTIKPFHLELIQEATTSKRLLALEPAAHGKTTIVSTLLPIREVCKDPDVRIALILKNDIDAKGVMQAIHGELLGNHELINDWGPFRADDKPWALEKTWVAKRTRRDKNPTLAAYGAGSRNALGHRSDLTICDDVVTDLNSATPERRAKLKEWFMQGPRTMAEDEDDRIVVVGTLFNPEDLYHDLLIMVDPETGAPIWDVLHRSAILELCFCGHERRNHQTNATCGECECQEFIWNDQAHATLWPERWSWKRLMELKAEMGTLDFNKRLCNVAVDPSRMVFREEYIKGGYIPGSKPPRKMPGCLDRQFTIGDFDPSWPVYCGFDPAIGTYRTAKFCAHVTVAVGSCPEHERCLWIVDIERDQMSLPQQVELIISQHEKYRAFITRIEANSYQAGLYQEVKRRMDEQGLAYKIEPHYTTRTNKPDPELGVQSMSPWYEDGKVHIPWGSPQSMRKMEPFIDELIQYPTGRTTDIVMGSWFAYLALQQTAPRFKSFNRLHSPKPTFFGSKTGRRTVPNPYYEGLRS